MHLQSEVTEEDRETLKTLAEKTLGVDEEHPTGKSLPHAYEDTHLDPGEVDDILSAVEENDRVFLYPGSSGFVPEYHVEQVEYIAPGHPERTRLLVVHTKQLPEEYGFDDFAEVFRAEENRRIAEQAGFRDMHVFDQEERRFHY